MLERILKVIDSFRWANWRVNNAANIRKRIERLTDLENDPERFFPLHHLELATLLFNMGEHFDIASIFHSSSALALGLVIKLNTRLSDGEKERLSLSFKRLIIESKDKGLLNKKHYELAEDIRHIRNCYVHFENMMAYIKRIYEYYRNRENIISKYKTKEEKRIAEIILNSQQIKPVSAPDLTWCAKMKTVKFLEKRHTNFSRELVRLIATSYGDQIEEKKIKREYERFGGLGVTTADASYCLNNTARILAYIGILPSDDQI